MLIKEVQEELQSIIELLSISSQKQRLQIVNVVYKNRYTLEKDPTLFEELVYQKKQQENLCKLLKEYVEKIASINPNDIDSFATLLKDIDLLLDTNKLLKDDLILLKNLVIIYQMTDKDFIHIKYRMNTFIPTLKEKYNNREELYTATLTETQKTKEKINNNYKYLQKRKE